MVIEMTTGDKMFSMQGMWALSSWMSKYPFKWKVEGGNMHLQPAPEKCDKVEGTQGIW